MLLRRRLDGVDREARPAPGRCRPARRSRRSASPSFSDPCMPSARGRAAPASGTARFALCTAYSGSICRIAPSAGSPRRTRWRLSNVMRSLPPIVSGGRQRRSRAPSRPSTRGGHPGAVVADRHLDLAVHHRVAPVAAQRLGGLGVVAHRAEAERPGADAGPHDDADLRQVERADRRVGVAAGEEAGERRDRRVAGRRGQLEGGGVVDLPVHLDERGVADVPRRARRGAARGGRRRARRRCRAFRCGAWAWAPDGLRRATLRRSGA